ncbi:hypothetical protein C8J55DRAFT_485744 [Lentinula edodes]|uniref:Uncharacterized protein n=1 Tax=Lentinula lateritia TaxID=40482 RepID=A0A9W9DZT6_9AGAR|nr:hypothetical protein C8J55DRAFT_485744 [Lentinula edodes]
MVYASVALIIFGMFSLALAIPLPVDGANPCSNKTLEGSLVPPPNVRRDGPSVVKQAIRPREIPELYLSFPRGYYGLSSLMEKRPPTETTPSEAVRIIEVYLKHQGYSKHNIRTLSSKYTGPAVEGTNIYFTLHDSVYGTRCFSRCLGMVRTLGGYYHAKLSTAKEMAGSTSLFPNPQHLDDVGLLDHPPNSPTLFVGFASSYFYLTNGKHSKYPPSSINLPYSDDTQKVVEGFVRDYLNERGYPHHTVNFLDQFLAPAHSNVAYIDVVDSLHPNKSYRGTVTIARSSIDSRWKGDLIEGDGDYPEVPKAGVLPNPTPKTGPVELPLDEDDWVFL